MHTRIMATRNALEVAEFVGAAEVLGAMLETLNPTEGNDWSISEVSFDGVLNTAILQLSQSLGLGGSSNNLVQTTIAMISYATLMEEFQNVLGIGSGFTKFDFSGGFKNYMFKA